ncbi:MAG: flavodoxin family protein [Acidobacteria bacterium]|nr:flavodoxin family protein [Acidobacteriota bacterium]
MKVVAFNGSPRPDGNTSILIGHVFSELRKEGIETELVQLGGLALRGCSACLECAVHKDGRCTLPDDGMNGFIQKMLAADGILIGSPTYFTDVTAETKALIDRAGYVTRQNGNLLRRKVGAAVVAVRRAGAIHAFDTLNHFFLINEMFVPGSSYWNIGLGRARGDVERDTEGIETMHTLGRNMAWLLQRVVAGPEMESK